MKQKYLYLFLFLSAVFILLRIYKIDADPSYISWSKGVLFDPAIYSLNLKNYLINNTPFITDNNYFLIFPGHFLLQYFFFKITPYNYITLNLYSVFLSFLTALFFFFTVKKLYNIKTAIIFFTISVISYVHISYSRIAYVETSMLLLCAAVLYFYFNNTKTSYFISGCLSVLLLITKITGIIIPVTIIIYELYCIITKKKNHKNLIIFISGFILLLLIFLLIFVLPNYHNYKELYASRIFRDVLTDHSPASNLLFQAFKINIFFNTNIFYKMPFITFLAILYFGTNIFKTDKYRIFYLIWLIISIIIINQSDYTPFRYRIIVMPLFYITASITLSNYKKIILEFKSVNSILSLLAVLFYLFLFRTKFPYLLIISGVIITLLSVIKFNYKLLSKQIYISFFILLVLFNVILFITQEKKRNFSVISFNNIVSDYFENNNKTAEISISGYGAPVFCMNTPVRVINYPNIPESLLDKYNIKYFIVRENEYQNLKNRFNLTIIENTFINNFNENIYFLKIMNTNKQNGLK